MAKHPVPKKKTSKARTSRRYKAFANRAKARLGNAIQIVNCISCGATVQQHRACTQCGNYRGKDLTASTQADATPEKVTTIKAD